jgi:hypothetical protein
MPRRDLRIPLCLGLIALLAALVAAGCGGGSGNDSPPASPPPTANVENFPKANGQSYKDLFGTVPEGPILAPTVSVLEKGKNRFGFALFDRAKKMLTGSEVVLYTATAQGGGVQGPYPARSESLAVKPQYVAKTTAQDPDAAKSVYVADVPFPKGGSQAIFAVARLDGRLVRSTPAAVNVGGVTKGGDSAASTFAGGSKGQPPRVGEKAPKITTPTLASVGGDASKIDTRVPPDTMHSVNYADVLGKKPIVIVFATPQLCQSRVCGPVVDIAEQLKAKYGDKAAFLHMEIYNGNQISKGTNEQVAAFRLPSEPWAFVIDKNGKVAARLEGAFSVGELDRAIAKGIPA